MSDMRKYRIPIYEFEPCAYDESDVVQFKEDAKVTFQMMIVVAIFALCNCWG